MLLEIQIRHWIGKLGPIVLLLSYLDATATSTITASFFTLPPKI